MTTMTFRTRAGRSLVVLLAVVGLAACSGGESTPVTVPEGTDLEVRAVAGLRWDKTSYEVAAGEIQIAVVNDDSMRHTLVIIEDGKIRPELDLVVNKRGDVDYGTITLEPGTYTIFCTVPGHQNMKSELIVR